VQVFSLIGGLYMMTKVLNHVLVSLCGLAAAAEPATMAAEGDSSELQRIKSTAIRELF